MIQTTLWNYIIFLHKTKGCGIRWRRYRHEAFASLHRYPHAHRLVCHFFGRTIKCSLTLLRGSDHFESARENAMCVWHCGQGGVVVNIALALFRVASCGEDGVSESGRLRQYAADATSFYALARELFLLKRNLADLLRAVSECRWASV